MTGEYAHRLGVTSADGGVPFARRAALGKLAAPCMKVVAPTSATYLPLAEYTLGEALHDGGYKTAHFGKWHLGALEKFWARHRGFDETLGGTGAGGPIGYFSPYFMENISDGPPGEYLADRLTDESLRFIEANRDRPFFLNLWHYSVHGPWQAKQELIEKYRKKADPANPQHNPVYAAMLDSMDQSLGCILDKIDTLGIADHTILIFMSDNGGVLRTEPRNAHSPPDTPVTSNAPLRGGKATVYEGGVREPMMVYWPGVTKPGTLCDEVVHAVDFYPTILEMVGLKPKPGKVLDGESLVPLLRGTGKLNREATFCHFPHYVLGSYDAPETFECTPATFVRRGDWKLIRFYGEGPGRSTRFELYNLKDDIGEAHSLAAARPDKVLELDALIAANLKATAALVPISNPGYLAPVSQWKAFGAVAMQRSKDVMKIHCMGIGGFVESPSFSMRGPLLIHVRARRPVDNESRWQSHPARPRFEWRTLESAKFEPDQLFPLTFDVPHDGQWHEVEVPFATDKCIAQLRLFPGYAPDSMDVAWIAVHEATLRGKDDRQPTWLFTEPD
jgi:arylsulfatase A-like enzyme